jgi:hypothetical protein
MPGPGNSHLLAAALGDPLVATQLFMETLPRQALERLLRCKKRWPCGRYSSGCNFVNDA